jgi:hypothetical protein
MNRYESPAPRVAIGFAAVAMAALTMGAMVVLPSRMESDVSPDSVVAASQNAAGPCVTAPPESPSSAAGHLEANRAARQNATLKQCRATAPIAPRNS